MEKFIYLFRGANGGMAVNPSPEEMQKEMQKWMIWMGELGKKGALIGGEPLMSEGKQVNGSKQVITDGPFIEAKEMVGGYLLINAKNMDEAVELSKGCPIFDHEGKLEVRQIRKQEM